MVFYFAALTVYRDIVNSLEIMLRNYTQLPVYYSKYILLKLSLVNKYKFIKINRSGQNIRNTSQMYRYNAVQLNSTTNYSL